MSIICNHDKCAECMLCVSTCPFGAIEYTDEGITITDSCVGCNSCVEACPFGALSNQTNEEIELDDLTNYSGVMVLVQVENDSILPVSYELLGKAKELANTLNEEVIALLLGHPELSDNLATCNIDRVINYTNIEYNKYNSNEYISALYDAINKYKPSILLIGATNEGRQLAPYVASKFNTGMTADCTDLKIKNGNLLQIRPAYGGKIMAEILTENSRPQIATVKNGVFTKIDKAVDKCLVVISDFYDKDTTFTSLSYKEKSNEIDLTKAQVILCIGNGVKDKSDVTLFSKVATKLGATLCSTRALVEKGFMKPNMQIGLSGNSVSPKLLITFGVSGSIQFLAGIKNAKNVIAVNTDINCNIKKRANYFVNMDIYELANKILEE